MRFVPSPRLIALVLVAGVPSAIAMALVPGADAWAAAVFVLLAAGAAVDLWRGHRAPRPMVSAPPNLRAYKGRARDLDLRIASPAAETVTAAIAWPPALAATERDRRIALPESPESAIPWPFTPTRRGDHTIPSIHIERPSRLGLWDLRFDQAINTGVRVYPNLQRVDDLLALRRDNLGAKPVRQIGKGREFEKLRDYLPGDGFDEIHWKATARRGRPVTKVFQVEQTREVYVVLDCSRLTGRAEGDEPRLERYMNAALVLGMAAHQSGDLFGLMAMSDRVETFVRARKGSGQAAVCREAIYRLHPKRVAANFEDAAVQLRTQLSRRALILFLADLDDPVAASQFSGAVRLLRPKHLPLVAMIDPPGARPLFSRPTVDGERDVYEEAAGHLLWRRLKDLQVTLRREGVRLSTHPSLGFAQHLVGLYREVKQRQIL